MDVDVGTDYDADLRHTREILGRVAEDTEGVLDEPETQVYLQQLGGSSIDWTVRVWAETGDYWEVKQRLTHSIKIALDDAGIGIPYPQMDVHVDGELTAAASARWLPSGQRAEFVPGGRGVSARAGTPGRLQGCSPARHIATWPLPIASGPD